MIKPIIIKIKQDIYENEHDDNSNLVNLDQKLKIVCIVRAESSSKVINVFTKKLLLPMR